MKFLKEKLDLRIYQQTILNTASQYNTLVILPTGLGKTHIAIALAGLRLKNNNKVLILAPTKPLISQHLNTFSDFFEFEENEIVAFSGEVAPEKRKELWKNARIIFSTPQTIKNDLVAGNINLEDVCLAVFDECHRASGDYDYVFLAQAYCRQAREAKLLALTASPGADEEQINLVCKNLFIEKIEARSREHEEVKHYVKKIVVEYVFAELPEALLDIKKRLDIAVKQRLENLKREGFVQSSDVSKINKKTLIALQAKLQGEITRGKYEVAHAISLCAGLLKLMHAHSLLESESLSALVSYLKELWDKSKTSKIRAVKDLVSDFNVRVAYSLAQKNLDTGVEHPKLEMLKQILEKQFREKKESKAIVFTEFRSNIGRILEEISGVDFVNAHKFIG